MGKIILMISLVFLSGCGSTMSLVGVADGCKVYRIADMEGYKYFSNCGQIK